MKILNIDLWKLYLTYVKETKSGLSTHKYVYLLKVNLTKNYIPTIWNNLKKNLFYREKLAQAYDFALEKIGMDLYAYSIWSDYVQFLRSVDASGSFAESQKITAVRKVGIEKWENLFKEHQFLTGPYLAGVPKSGPHPDHRHRSALERVHSIWAKYQSDHFGEDELGTIAGLHERETSCKGIGIRYQRIES